MHIKRRRRAAFAAMVAASAVTATGGLLAQAPSQAVAPGASPPLDKFVNELPNPLAAPFRMDLTSGGTVELDEVAGTHSFGTQAGSPFAPTPSFGYWPAGQALDEDWGAYLGPTIEAKKGVPIKVTVNNKLVRKPDGWTAPTTDPKTCDAPGSDAPELKVISPMASYFDGTIEGANDIDRCAPPTAVHLHGAHTEAKSDGGPMDVFVAAGISSKDGATDSAGNPAPGTGSRTYFYGNDQEAAGLWYHDHAMANTRFNPMSGLAGFYLIRDDNDTGRSGNSLGLPYTDDTTAQEVPIVLQDRQFKSDGSLWYPPGVTPGHPNWAPESFGDVAVVNGTAWPRWTVKQGLYRVRLLNGSNARFYRLQVHNAQGEPAPVPIYQIGAEGGLFNSPVPVTAMKNGRILIAPGERADLVFDFRNVPAGAYTWANNAAAPFPNGANDLKQIMRFVVTAGSGQPVDARWAKTPWPSAPVAQTQVKLRGGGGQEPVMGATVPTAAGTPTTNSCWTDTNNTRPCRRTMFLNEVLDPVTGAPVEVLLNNLKLTKPGHGHDTPTGHVMDTGPGQPHVDINTVEQWDIVNVSADAHPIHLHTTQFRVINRQKIDAAGYLAAVNPALPFVAGGGSGVQSSNGKTPPPDPTPFLRTRTITAPGAGEKGWKDTVIADPGTVTRILVPFGGTADTMVLPANYTGARSAFIGGPGAQFTGDFVWHCHILEHEENDMMQGIVIR